MRPRLLFIDVDGTLVHATDRIAPRTLTALETAWRAGCTTVLCTGRSRYTARTVASQLHGEGYAIYLNGGLVFDEFTGQRLKKTVLGVDIAEGAIQAAHALGMAPLCFAVEEDDRWVYADRRVPVVEGYQQLFPDRLVYVNELPRDLPAQPVSVETYGTPEQTERLLARWREDFGERTFTYGWDATRFGCRGVHIHCASVDKAPAARSIAERLGVPRERTIAIGDEINDRRLIEWAGIGIAMENAHPDCIACADHVTASCEEDGVALAVERFVLNGYGS